MDEFDQAASQVAGTTFDSAASGVVSSQRQTYRPVLYNALLQNPDMAARANRLGRKTGMPSDVIGRNLPEVERNAQLDEYDHAILNSPTLSKWLSDQSKANASHDDVGVLASMERVIRDWATGKRTTQSIPQVMSGAEFSQQVQRAVQENPALDIDTARTLVASGRTITNDQIAGESRGPQATVANVLAGIFSPERVKAADAGLSVAAADLLGVDNKEPLQKYRRAQFRASLADPQFETATGKGLYSGGVSLVQNSPGIALSIILGNPAPGLAMAGGGVAAESYGKYRERGGTPGQATTGAALEGGIEVATEMLPMGFLVNKLGKVGMGEFLKGMLAREVPGEQLATLAQDAVDTAIANPNKTWGDYIKERPGAAYETLLATVTQAGAMGAVNAAASKFTQRDEEAQRAEQAAAVAQVLSDLSKESKLLQRDPEAFAEFVNEVADDADLFIDSEVLTNTLNQSGITMDALGVFAPRVAEQLRTSTPGADIRVPVAEFVAAGPDINSLLIDHVRETPDAMSRAEAQEYLKTEGESIRADVEREVTSQVQQTQYQQDVDTAAAAIEAQLTATGKFQPNANKAYALMHGYFYATQAQRIGIPVQEFMQRYGLNVTSREVTGQQQVEQGAVDTPEFRNWFGESKVVDAEGKPLVVYHGTAADFNVFDLSKFGLTDAGWFGKGFYFTEDKAIADRYGKTKSVFLSLEKPMSSDEAAFGADTVKQIIAETKRLDPKFSPKDWLEDDLAGEKSALDQLENMYRAGAETSKVLQAVTDVTGFDGVVSKGIYIAFNPTQIKSAIGNSGAFDPNDPNILNQSRSPETESLIAARPAEPQTLEQGARANLTFANDITTTPSVISLLEGADLSSFPHESGHFFLEVEYDLAKRILAKPEAERSEAERKIVQDMETLLKWFGVNGTDQTTAMDEWSMMSLDQRREHHEKFARGFERYLMEGKAPNQELQSIFNRFRAWLVQIYKAMKALNVELTDDVRAVMDRMLATNQAIQVAQDARNMGPLFTSPEMSGMTPEEFAAYQALGQQSTGEAAAELDARLLKDMKWLSRARDKAMKAAQAEADDLRKEIEQFVRAEIMSEEVYQAWAFLTGKYDQVLPGTVAPEDMDSLASGKLRTSLVKAIDPEAWSRLSERRMTSEDKGIDPDILAETFGFSSGDEMVRKLAAAPPPQQVIEELTDARMLQQYGDISSPEALARAADEAVYNESRLRTVAAELKALTKAGSVREGKRSTTDVLARAAKDYAEQIIARLKVRDIRPSVYGAAQARSAKLAQQSLGKSTEEAALHKRNELINGYAKRAADQALREVEEMRRYFRKFDKRRKSIDPGYQDQIEQLLERHEFKSVGLKVLDKREAFSKWYADRLAEGAAPNVPDELIHSSGLVSYKNMTMEELRGLRDAVKQIEHLGRLKNKLLLARDKREFDAIAEEMAASIVDNGGKARPVELEGPSPVADLFAGLAVSHRKISSLFRQMDGMNDAGPLYEHIGRGMNERGTMEDVMVEKATIALRDLYAPLMKMRGGITGARSKVFIPEINASLTRGGRLAVALNWGNEANRQRIRDGDKWTDAQVAAIIRTLSPAELEFVNQTWDYLDSYWPEISAKEKRLTGVEPEKVQAEPFTAIASDGIAVKMRGGYYPLKYDTERSDRAGQLDAAQVAKDMLQGAYARATTRRGHTKARLEEVKRPLRKDLNVITQHITQVTHDLAWHEWLVDTNKILNDKRVAEAIRAHYGPQTLKAIRDSVQAIAAGDSAGQDAIDKALLLLRSNVTRATMGASVTTAFLQPFGLTQSIVRIGAKHVLVGAARWAGDTARMESTVSWIHGKSDFMRLRSKTFNRELREIRGAVGGKSSTMQAIDGGLFFMMQKMQMVADIPTWAGQYQKSLAEGLDDASAVAMADRAVIEAQGAGSTKDLAGVQRNHPFLTQFYSYFSVTLNLAVESTKATDFKNPRAVAGWIGDMTLLAIIPAIVPALLLDALRGGDDDDMAAKVAKWQLVYLMGLVVGIRELSGAVAGFDYTGPPVGRIATDIGKAGKQTVQGELDEPAVLAYARLMGTALGIPVTQLIRSYKGWKAWDEGDEGAGPQSVLLGPPPKD